MRAFHSQYHFLSLLCNIMFWVPVERRERSVLGRGGTGQVPKEGGGGAERAPGLLPGFQCFADPKTPLLAYFFSTVQTNFA